MAELLSGVVLYQLAEPGCQVVSNIGAAAAEMRSGLYLAGTPEVGLINTICIEMSHHYGLRTMGSGVGPDAKHCDLQAGSEGTLTGLACALAGSEAILAIGLLDGAQMVSLAKAVLDDDTCGAIRRYVREDPIDASTALFEDIRDIGIGGHFLGAKSTRRFSRSGELWQPKTFRRQPFETYAGSTLVKEAQARAEELIAADLKTPVTDDVACGRRRGDRSLPGDQGLTGDGRTGRAAARQRRRPPSGSPVLDGRLSSAMFQIEVVERRAGRSGELVLRRGPGGLRDRLRRLLSDQRRERGLQSGHDRRGATSPAPERSLDVLIGGLGLGYALDEALSLRSGPESVIGGGVRAGRSCDWFERYRRRARASRASATRARGSWSTTLHDLLAVITGRLRPGGARHRQRSRVAGARRERASLRRRRPAAPRPRRCALRRRRLLVARPLCRLRAPVRRSSPASLPVVAHDVVDGRRFAYTMYVCPAERERGGDSVAARLHERPQLRYTRREPADGAASHARTAHGRDRRSTTASDCHA